MLKKIIAIGAGKGGVGKSTITTHLALALKRMGFEVGILDADVYGPSIHHMLPCDQELSLQENQWVPALCAGIKLMSVAYFKRSAAIVRAPIANETIEKFLTQTAWGALDYLLIDFPPGTGDVQLTLLQKASFSGAILVTTPQEIALLDVRKAHLCFQRMGVKVLGVVENMSYFQMAGERCFPLGEGGGERLANEIAAPLLGKVPLEPLLALAGDQGVSLFDTGAQTPAAASLWQMAKKLDQFFEKDAGHAHFELIWKSDLAPFATENRPISAHTSARVQKIFQAGPKEFVIEWTDGGVCRYDLAKLQTLCPCARCQSQNKVLNENVSAKKIYSVGRLGLKIEFSAGCQSGIFSFDFLRRLV